MSPDEAENVYRQLGRLIEVMPVLTGTGKVSAEMNQWLGRAYALVHKTGDIADSVNFKHNVTLLSRAARNTAAEEIYAIVHRAFAVAELSAPAGASGAFIPVGNSFDAFSAISKILGSANSDILIIDPYMDEVTLTDFGITVPEKVNLRLMADQQDHKVTLIPAAKRWMSQYSASRPLEVRLASPRSLHDRAIFIDGVNAYSLTQSLNAFAKRSPAEIIRADDTAQLKISAYEQIWSQAQPVTL